MNIAVLRNASPPILLKLSLKTFRRDQIPPTLGQKINLPYGNGVEYRESQRRVRHYEKATLTRVSGGAGDRGKQVIDF